MRQKMLLFSIVLLFFCGLVYSADDKPVLHLPFSSGASFQCTQPNYGVFSHDFSTTKYALDFGAPVGTPLIAMASGTAYVYDNPDGYDYESYGGFGCHVKVDHGNGYYTLYAHMRSISVSHGQFVEVGDSLGLSGGDNTLNHICNGHSNAQYGHIHIALHQGNATSQLHSKAVPSNIFAAKSSTAKAYLMASSSFATGSAYWSDNIPVNIDDYFTCDSYGCYVCSSPCWGGGQGLSDLVVPQIWLDDSSGNEKFLFNSSEQIKIKAKFKNVGASNLNQNIQFKSYRSNGEHVDSNKQTVGTGTIQASNLESGETKTETMSIYAPTTPGTYNITACVNTSNSVAEEHENNNCSEEAVFIVVKPFDFLRLMNIILQ